MKRKNVTTKGGVSVTQMPPADAKLVREILQLLGSGQLTGPDAEAAEAKTRLFIERLAERSRR